MSSIEALRGTGVSTAAFDLLETEGVKEVTISIPGGSSLTVSKDTLNDKLGEIEDLFEELAGAEAKSGALAGKSIKVAIILEEGYTTEDSKEFTVEFENALNVTF